MSDTLVNSRILILILGHLANMPRPQKEAKALRKAGAQVLIRGVWWSSTLAKEDTVLAQDLDVDFKPVIDLREGGFKSFLIRLRQRIAVECFKRVGWVTPRVFGLGEQLKICDNIIFEFLEDSDETKIRKILHILNKAGFKLKDVTGNDWQLGYALPERNIWASRGI